MSIDFTLSDEQREIQALAHTFAEEEIRPVAAELDEREEFPWDLVKKAGELGLTTFAFPEELGGLGITDELTNCIITEELSWGCGGVATVLGGTHLASIPILLAGTDEQKQRLLKPIVQRNGLCAMALTEPEAGSDVAAMTTTARREGDYYVLNGAKRFITNGGIADLYVVFATVDRALGHRGVTAFIVPGDTPGVSGGKKEKKLGIRCSHTGEVLLDDVRVPVENRLGEEGSGFKLAMTMLDRSRPMVAAIALGIARAAYEYARDYAKERVQFGKPIAEQSGDPVPAGRHGDEGAGGAADDLVVGEGHGDGPPLPLREQHGQELRLRCGDGGHDRRRADLRRLRLHPRVSRREALPRRQDHADLRGHEPDPEDRRRPADPEMRRCQKREVNEARRCPARDRPL